MERYRRYLLVERALTRPRVYVKAIRLKAIRPFVASSNGSERLELRVGLKAEPEPRILAGEFVRLFVCC